MGHETGLGKGMDAIFGSAGLDPDEFIEGGSAPIHQLPIDQIDNDTGQPRQVFDEKKLEELAQSIRTHGIMQPLVVSRIDGGRFRIVAGERRFRAAKMAQQATVPVVVRDVEEGSSALELALIENIQREDLNPIEQAEALTRLMEEYGLKQEEVAARVGKSRPAIANLVRLMHLPEPIRNMVSAGTISAGHARALLPLDDEQAIVKAAGWVIKNDLSVRQTEEMVRGMQKESAKDQEKPPKKVLSPEVREAQQELSTLFDTKVRIVGSEAKGKITIDYYSKEQLNNLYDALRRGSPS